MVADARFDSAIDILTDKARAKRINHEMTRCGYGTVRNPDDTSGRWIVAGKRMMIYARNDLPEGRRIDAARKFVELMASKRGANDNRDLDGEVA